jgi:dTMP kinase
VAILGSLAGIAYATGNTIVGLEVDDATRGRTFAFFQSTIQVILFLVIAVSGVVASGFTKLISDITGSGNVQIGQVVYHSVGQNVVLLLAAGVAAACGITAYRKMDDRKGVPLRQDLMRAIRREPMFAVAQQQAAGSAAPARRGLLIALEGGEGAGKTSQARSLAIWLRDQGYDVMTTHEPGGTKVGMRMRAMLLDTAHAGLDPRAEALMYAADRAEHVTTVIKPALARGTIVVTDRYVDSSLAYQGAGRCLPLGDVTRINRWATDGLTPDLTILLDLPPAAGLNRRARSADRLEAEPADFHNRVRVGFRQLADAEPGRYLVLDATQPPDAISREIQQRVRELLPDPVPPSTEAETSTFPAITEPVRASPDHEPEGNGGNHEAGLAGADHEAGLAAGAEREAGLAAGADHEGGLAAGAEREAGLAAGADHEAGLAAGADHEAGLAAGADHEAGLAAGADHEAGRAGGGRHGGGANADGEDGRVGGSRKPGRSSAG